MHADKLSTVIWMNIIINYCYTAVIKQTHIDPQQTKAYTVLNNTSHHTCKQSSNNKSELSNLCIDKENVKYIQTLPTTLPAVRPNLPPKQQQQGQKKFKQHFHNTIRTLDC